MIPAFIFPMIEEKHAMKDTSRPLAPGFWIVFAVIVLMVTGNGGPALADDGPFPWIYGGYKDIGEVHLRYWTADREALESVENLRNGRVDGEICDIWYRKSPPSFRMDRYVPENRIVCNQFKGKEWEKTESDGKTWVLKERTIQKAERLASWTLQNIASGGGRELCEYRKFEGTRRTPESLKNVLSLLSVVPYTANPESKELDEMGLEMGKLLDPGKYETRLKDLRKRHEKAGRPSARYETTHGIIRFPARGYAFVDLAWGIGLEGYLTGGGSLEFPEPVCIYRVLAIDTAIKDQGVFEDR